MKVLPLLSCPFQISLEHYCCKLFLKTKEGVKK